MKYVYILWGSDSENPWIESIFSDSVKAEEALRYLKETDQNSEYIYWVQVKTVS